MTDNMEDLSKLFDRYCNIMKHNTNGTQIGIYSVAIIGLSVAMRRVRPFSRFRKPTDVPNLFIRNRRELTGTVERIEPNGALLMVNHKPLIPLPGNKSEKLPLKVSNVNVTGHGLSWLQAIVAGNEITFIPVSKTSKYVECEIILPQKLKKNKTHLLDVGEALVSVGFGRIELDNSKNLMHMKYLDRLMFAEERALRKEMGMKYYIKPTKLILISLIKKLNNLLEKAKKIQLRKPAITASTV